ncbi:MAG: response regulator transcription factor [Candidatus Omnitrophica bacterium]|nr:response regulator transcription factor [Candidatus Omnitrophota bacterium]MDD5429354.1 response regulator transcription factor [Candidatus Omnitrophota bacterium]
MAIEVILIDDHSIVRQGIRAVISREKDITIVGEAADGATGVKIAKDKKPDIAIIDITLPLLNGLEATRQILRQNRNTKVLILSMHENHVFVEKALSYGAKGYILKESAADEIVRAIREVYSGGYFLSSKVSSLVIREYARKKNRATALKSISVLTDREREILQLISEGLSSKEVAKKLDLALKTTLVHRNNIMRKLNIHNQAQLIRFAIKEGLSSL